MSRYWASKTKSGAAGATAATPAASGGSAKESNAVWWDAGDLDEETARLANSYWEARGRTGGSASEDWVRAKQELGARQRH